MLFFGRSFQPGNAHSPPSVRAASSFCSRSRGEPQSWLKEQSISLERRSWGNWDYSAGRKESAGETLLWPSSIFRGPLRGMGTNVSSGPVGLGQGEMFFYLKREWIWTIIRRKFSTMRVVKHWHLLPREVVSAVSLETLKIRSNKALNNLIYLKMFLLIGGALG